MLKKLTSYTMVIAAIYWLAPSMRFNVLRADDQSTTQSQQQPGTKADHLLNRMGDRLGGSMSQKQVSPERAKLLPAYASHGTMTESYLTSSLDFVNGLSKLTKEDRVSLSDGVVKSHLQMYAKNSLENLKQARVHLDELKGTVSREPAAASDIQNQMNETRMAIDRAIQLNTKLQSDVTTMKDKNALNDEASRLHDRVKDALSKDQSLNDKLGV